MKRIPENFKKSLYWRNQWNFSWLDIENSTHRLTLLMWKYFSFCASIHDSSWFCSNRRTTDCWHSMLGIDLNKKSEIVLHWTKDHHSKKEHTIGVPNHYSLKSYKVGNNIYGILVPKLFGPTVRKIVPVIEKNFWIRGWRPRICKKNWDKSNHLFKQVRRIFVKRMLF